MAIQPAVRLLIHCDNWQVAPTGRNSLNVLGQLANIPALQEPVEPLFSRTLRVAELTGG
jgi:hypothetical protein